MLPHVMTGVLDAQAGAIEKTGAAHPSQVGFLGIALTRSARIKKQTKRLYRLNKRADRIADKIESTEDKLEALGVDPKDLYEGWAFEDLVLDRTPDEPSRRPFGGRTPADPYGGRDFAGPGAEREGLDDEDDDDLRASGLVFLGSLY